jgi:hypothetical protein
MHLGRAAKLTIMCFFIFRGLKANRFSPINKNASQDETGIWQRVRNMMVWQKGVE